MKKLILALLTLLAITNVAHAYLYQPTNIQPIISSEIALSLTSSIGTATTSNIKSGQGNLYHASVYNGNAAARFLWLCDGANIGDAGTSPNVVLGVWLIPATNQIALGPNELSITGQYFANALSWGFSTSATSFTAGSAGDCVAFFCYK